MTPKPLNSSSTSSLASVGDEAVVVVTPYSTGCCLAQQIQRRGYKLIVVWTRGFSEVMKTHQPAVCSDLKYEVELDEQETIAKTAEHVSAFAESRGWSIVGCVCGGEAGVDLTDALSEYMGLLSNGTDIPNRRDKKVQQELIAAAGLRSVRQCSGTTLEEVQEFLRKESYPVIVKPLDSAGSDGVKLCKTLQEAEEHVQLLLGDYDLVNGGQCHEVLCQEFLKGKEYVVDHVSRNGVHKTSMVWVYDKRAVNGADFVYFGDIPVEMDTPEAQALIPYARGVLDALGVRNGPSHGEIIITEDGTPCLVEMNCRTHGGDGIWLPLCSALTGGYNQVDMSVSAYLDEEAFNAIPDIPCAPFKAHGQCVDMVSFSSGTVKSTPGYDLIRSLPSFIVMETHIRPGSKVVPTVDMATDIGNCVVMHTDKKVLETDIELIRTLESKDRMFEYEQDEDWNRRRLTRPLCSLEGLFSTKPSQFIVSQNRHRRIVSSDHPDMYMH